MEGILPLLLAGAVLWGTAAAFSPGALLPTGPGGRAAGAWGRCPRARGALGGVLWQQQPGRRSPHLRSFGRGPGGATAAGMLAVDQSKAEAALARWAAICEKEGLGGARGGSITPADFVKLWGAAVQGAKRRDAVADVGAGCGAVMAMAAAVAAPGQAALVVSEEQHSKASSAVEKLEAVQEFSCCQAIKGDVQDFAEGTRLLTYFDVVFADSREGWGIGADGPCTTLSAAAGQACLEGTRIVTIGRRLVNEEGVWGYKLLSEVPLQGGGVGFVWEVERSLKSRPRDAKPEEQFKKGAEVRIVNLQKATQHNGSVGIVVEEGEGGLFSVFIDDTCQTLKVRAKNLEPFVMD